MEAINVRVIRLIDEIGNSNYIKSNQTDELFKLNNELFPHLKEHGKSCAPCRLRVYNRVLTYYHTINKDG